VARERASSRNSTVIAKTVGGDVVVELTRVDDESCSSVAEKLQLGRREVAARLQRCCSSVAEMLQFGRREVAARLQRCCSSVAEKLQLGCREVAARSQRCCSSVAEMLQFGRREVAARLQRCCSSVAGYHASDLSIHDEVGGSTAGRSARSDESRHLRVDTKSSTPEYHTFDSDERLHEAAGGIKRADWKSAGRPFRRKTLQESTGIHKY